MAERRFPWSWVLSLGALVLVGALVWMYLHAMHGLVQGYYLAEYRAAPLGEADLGQPPPAHRLGDVPWLSEQADLSPSVSLRMLAAQQGRAEPRSTLDFLLGSTWGASPIPGRTGFWPGQDAEVGFLRAAPALGFTRRYLTTDRSEDFLRALRTFLSRGRAVRVMLDRALLLDRSGLEPHSLVLVGYDAAGFEYYEPTCEDHTRCQAGEQVPGSTGLTVKTDRLLMAVESQSLALQYPWKYQLMVLEPAAAGSAGPTREALLVANARALLGLPIGQGPSLGAELVTDTAKALERHGDGVVSPELVAGVRLAAVARRDDAEALAELFPGRADLVAASERLDEASKAYGRAASALQAKQPEVTLALEALLAGANADRAAGEAMLRSTPP
jgi:hypothetical protein